jgi:hypothetical protein
MLTLHVDVSHLHAMTPLSETLQVRLAVAVHEACQYIQRTWHAAVLGVTLPGMTRQLYDEVYAAQVAAPESLDYPFNGDPFWGRVIVTNPAHAERVEVGYPPYDMKPGLLASPKAHTGAHGQRYITVPFRHGTPTSLGQAGPSMPQGVYAKAKRLAPFMGGPWGMEIPGKALKLTGEAADWGRRSKLPTGTMTGPYTWKASPYQGMRRVGGTPLGTSYMTFRRVSSPWVDAKGKAHGSDPNAWMHPGMPPNPVLQAVYNAVEPAVSAALANVFT